MKLFKLSIFGGLVCLTFLSAHSLASAREQLRSTPVWDKVAIVRWTIVPQNIAGAPARSDQNSILQRLSKEAGARTERLLLKKRVAGSIEHVESSQEITAPVFVTGTLTLPISLPPGVLGLKARSREGVFVVARVILSDQAGKILATEQSILNWNDVHWTYGARRKRNHTLDDVLTKFTRKAVDQASERLARQSFIAQAR